MGGFLTDLPCAGSKGLPAGRQQGESAFLPCGLADFAGLWYIGHGSITQESDPGVSPHEAAMSCVMLSSRRESLLESEAENGEFAEVQSMKKRKTIRIVLLSAALLIGGLRFVSSHPFVSLKCDVPEEAAAEICRQSLGVYSNRLPLLPVLISIESVSNEQVFYTIHYFPFGTVGMTYSAADGFNQVKPLTGLR